MRTRNIIMIALLTAAPCASAQLAIQWDTFDSGSGVLMNGGLVAHDTIGQSDAGELATSFTSMNGGFWTFGAVYCPGDVTTQGAGPGDPLYGIPDDAVTASDINFYVNAWVADDPAIADLTTQGAGPGDPGYAQPDGLVTAADIQFYVNVWTFGCP